MKSDLALRLIAGFLTGIDRDSICMERPEVKNRVISLKRDEVARLDRGSGVSGIEVKRGVLWLTSTPANGDVLLHSGESFELANQWPYVIQALEESEVIYSGTDS